MNLTMSVTDLIDVFLGQFAMMLLFLDCFALCDVEFGHGRQCSTALEGAQFMSQARASIACSVA
jgi:hypothetical protein